MRSSWAWPCRSRNIVRDIAVDAARDRIYLPLEDLAPIRSGPRRPSSKPRRASGRGPRPSGLDALLAFRSRPCSRPLRAGAACAAGRRPARHAFGRDHGAPSIAALLEEITRRGIPARPCRSCACPVPRKSRPRACATVPRVYWGTCEGRRPRPAGFAGLATAVGAPGESAMKWTLLERRGVPGRPRPRSYRDALSGEDVEQRQPPHGPAPIGTPSTSFGARAARTYCSSKRT